MVSIVDLVTETRTAIVYNMRLIERIMKYVEIHDLDVSRRPEDEAKKRKIADIITSLRDKENEIYYLVNGEMNEVVGIDNF